MRRGSHDHHRHLPDVQASGAMKKHEPAQLRPRAARLDGDSGQARRHVLVIGLVLEPRHVGTTRRVVAHRSHEQHHTTARRLLRPGQRLLQRQGFVAEAHPVVAARGREQSHAESLRDYNSKAATE